MANGYLGFQNPTSEDKKLDTTSLTVAAQTVHRERINIAGAADVDLAVVTNADPGASDYGLVSRDPGLNSRIGEVQASPTANTLLARLKLIESYTDGIEGKLDTVITSVQLIDNMIAGSEGQVDVVSQPALSSASDSVGVAGAIKAAHGAAAAMTITLASLASSTSGVGRQSTLVDNTANLYKSALVHAKITVGTSPTANTFIYVYLIRYDNSAVGDDGCGANDAGLTVINSPLLGTILVPATTSNTAYYGVFDTSFLGPLGSKWGIAVVNSTGAALHATGGNHTVNFVGIKETIATS